MTIDGRSAAATDVAKRAPLKIATAADANLAVFMILSCIDITDEEDARNQTA
jgi:hypothetical protein